MYSPKVKEELVARLYPICQTLGIPMNVFVNGVTERAVLRAEEYLAMGDPQQVFGMIGVEISGDVAD